MVITLVVPIRKVFGLEAYFTPRHFDAMAKLVGEQEFSLLFHKGTECNIHFSKIDDELLLITMFGKSISLGFLRLNVVETIERIKKIWNRK